MKTLKISLVLCLFSLAACSPRDPAVLTPAEKAKSAARFNKRDSNDSFSGNDGAAGMPAKIDISFASVLLDRQSESFAVLKLATALVEGQGQAPVEKCVGLSQTEKTDAAWTYALDLSNCFKKVPGSTQSQDGALTLTLQFDANKKLEIVTLKSPRVTENTLDAYKVKLTKEGKKGAVDIQDQIDIVLRRTAEEPMTYSLKSLSVTVATQAMGKDTQVSNISTKTTGSLEVSPNEAGDLVIKHNLNSTLYFTQKTGDKNGPFFNIALYPNSKRKGEPNVETLSSCRARTGVAAVNFTYKYSYKNNTVNYDEKKIAIVDEKNPKNNSQLETNFCDAKAPKGFAGLMEIDWAQVLLF